MNLTGYTSKLCHCAHAQLFCQLLFFVCFLRMFSIAHKTNEGVGMVSRKRMVATQKILSIAQTTYQRRTSNPRVIHTLNTCELAPRICLGGVVTRFMSKRVFMSDICNILQLYENNQEHVLIADVDCTVEHGLCNKNGVDGYPTVKYWVANGKQAQEYYGGRDLHSLQTFVDRYTEVLSICWTYSNIKCHKQNVVISTFDIIWSANPTSTDT